MKKFLPLLALGLLAACGARTTPIEQASAPSPIEAVSESSSASVEGWKSEVLVDQDYNVSGSGSSWLKSIGTKLITGNVTQARLSIDLSRGNDDKGWSAIGMYVAPQKTFTTEDGKASFKSPDESVYGTHLHFIDATWSGNCKRNLSANSSFGVLKEHSNSLVVELSSDPVSKGDDGCDAGKGSIDVMSALNDGGVYLGFMPSNLGYHAKVTLEYRGDITVSPF
jgi:hypothetical protein